MMARMGDGGAAAGGDVAASIPGRSITGPPGLVEVGADGPVKSLLSRGLDQLREVIEP